MRWILPDMSIIETPIDVDLPVSRALFEDTSGPVQATQRE